jgi:hypothetical protein
MEDEQLDEQDYRNLLEYNRARSPRDREILSAIEKIQPPSKSAYHRILTAAITLDILDLLELTVVGAILTYFLKIVFTPWFYSYGKKAGIKIEEMVDVAKSIQEGRILQFDSSASSKSPYINQFKYNSNKARTAKKTVELITRNPRTRIVWALIADYVPLLDLIPWRSWGIYKSYHNEFDTFEEVTPIIENFLAQQFE